MRKENGITLIALTITIIVIIILAGIVSYSGSQLIKESKLQTIKTEMLLIKGKAETIKDKANFVNKDNALVGEKIEGGALDGWYKWDEDDYASTGLTGIKNGVVYYVNYDDDIDVYYEEGYEHTDGNTYYKLSDIKNLTM